VLAASSAPPKTLKLFISYSRRDLLIADSFVAELEAQNFEVVIDRRDLPYGEEWQKELGDFIRSSDTVLWLISEKSLASKWVKWELGEVERLKKRLVPVRIANVDPDTLPESLQKIHVLPAEAVFDFGQHLLVLVHALTTNAAWLKEATRLSDRASQWKAKDQDEAQLLRGRALLDAESWASAKPSAAPAINREILDLLLQSRQGVSRRQRRTVVVSVLLAIGAFVLAFYAWQQRNTALVSESTYLSKLSDDSSTKGDAVTGALLAMSALPAWPFALDRPFVPEAARRLYDALFSMREAQVLKGHEKDVNTAVFSADDKSILTASDDGTARLWRADTGELIRTIGIHSSKVLFASFIANDRLILTFEETPLIWLWNAADGKADRALVGHSDQIKSVEVARSGERIVSASLDQTARVWRLDSRIEPPIVLREHHGPVNTATFSPDGKQVLTASDDGSAIVWSLETGLPDRQPYGHPGPVLRAIFNQDGSRIATIAKDRTVRVWNALTGELISKMDHGQLVSTIAFCPSTDCMVTAASDGVIRKWDIKTGDFIADLNGHSGEVMKVVVNPARKNSMVTVGRDGAVFMWDLETADKVLALYGHTDNIFDASFSSTGEFLVTTSRDKTARIWRVPAAITTSNRTNLGAETRTIDIDSNAKLVALGSYSGTVALLETSTFTRLASAKVSERAVTLIKFNEQASHVLLGSEDGSVALYSIPKLEPLYRASTDGSEIAAGFFTGAGFAVLTLDGGVYMYDGKTLSQVGHHTYDSASTIALTTGDRALVAGAKGAAWIIDNVSGRKIFELKGHSGSVLHAAFDPAGSIAVTASEDGTGIVWDAATGDPLNVLTGHQLPLSYVALSEDGRFVATASLDQTIRIWRRGASTPLAVYRGHLASVQAVRFLPSGGLVSASQDGELHFWHFDGDYRLAVSTARAMLPRCFTTKQLAAFGLKESPQQCRSKAN
jgi:WD40 repeat protein